MKKILISFVLLAQVSLAQTVNSGVGIGNDNPSRELDVSGTLTSKDSNDKWYFEDLGVFDGNTNNSYLTVIDKEDNKLKIFDPAQMSYASINYATFRFNKLPVTGLEYYDTKIDADKYHVMIGGFIVYGGNKDDDKVWGSSAKISKNVLYSSRAYIKEHPDHSKTWILKFQPNNNAVFQGYARVDIVLNVAIYRKNLLLMDTNPTLTINMNNSSVGEAPKPLGVE